MLTLRRILARLTCGNPNCSSRVRASSRGRRPLSLTQWLLPAGAQCKTPQRACVLPKSPPRACTTPALRVRLPSLCLQTQTAGLQLPQIDARCRREIASRYAIRTPATPVAAFLSRRRCALNPYVGHGEVTSARPLSPDVRCATSTRGRLTPKPPASPTCQSR